METKMAVYINSMNACASYGREGRHVLRFVNVTVYATRADAIEVAIQSANATVHKARPLDTESHTIGLLPEDCATVSHVKAGIRNELISVMSGSKAKAVDFADIVPFEGMADALKQMNADYAKLTESK